MKVFFLIANMIIATFAFSWLVGATIEQRWDAVAEEWRDYDTAKDTWVDSASPAATPPHAAPATPPTQPATQPAPTEKPAGRIPPGLLQNHPGGNGSHRRPGPEPAHGPLS